MEVWNHFDRLFNIRSFQTDSIQSRRFNRSRRKSQVGYVTSMLTIFSVWELWKEGNSSKLENPISQPAAIIQKITDWLKDCSQLLDIRSSWTKILFFWMRSTFIKLVNSQLTPKSLLIASMKIKKPLKLPIPRLMVELHFIQIIGWPFPNRLYI